MEILASFLIIIAFISSFVPLRDVPSGEVAVHTGVPGFEHTLKHDVKPLDEFTFESIVKQKYDYSCGSAALATVLNYHMGEVFTEQQVIQGLMTYGDVKLIEQRRAFSLLDMKRFVTVLGYSGAGYTATLDDLRGLTTPGIVPIEFYGYTHFVVYRGIYKDHVFLADPFMGNISFPVSQFEEMWHRNIVFLVTDGGTVVDMLRLDETDLRIVEFQMHREMGFEQLPDAIIQRERSFKESLGDTYQYRTLDVR